jgi:hypothetical protein
VQSSDRRTLNLAGFGKPSQIVDRNTMYGIGFGKGKNPIVNTIDEAAKWLHENNLGK